jgi:hypothetical protein
MVKDPSDNSPELDLTETIPVPSGELEFKSTLTPEQVEAAEKEVRGRPYSGRHPELGKMIKCQVHGRRHRQFEFGVPCEQKFTHTVNGYQVFREEVVPATETEPETVKLVPDLRTAAPPDEKPTVKQIIGAAQFAKKRYNPHYSTLAQRLVQRTRQIFEAKGFSLDAETKEEGEEFKKNLRHAKEIAASEIGKELSISLREFKRRKLL